MPMAAGSTCASPLKVRAIGCCAICSIAVRDGWVSVQSRSMALQKPAGRRWMRDGSGMKESIRSRRGALSGHGNSSTRPKQSRSGNALSVHRSHRAGWRNDKHAGHWAATLRPMPIR